MTCKHCSDPILPDRRCPTCGDTLTDQCKDCHNELAHGWRPKPEQLMEPEPGAGRREGAD